MFFWPANEQTKSVVKLHVWCVLIMLHVAAASAQDVSFHRQVVPLLTRAGCNAGACHGAATGRGGLHLSLFGSRPREDYLALVQQFEGRRIHRVTSAKSLLLRKPLGELDHGGDQVFETDSLEYKTLKAWIDQGATLDSSPHLQDFHTEVTSKCINDQPTFQLTAWASLHQGGDAPSDVTRLTQFVAADPDSMQLDLATAKVKLTRPGRHVLIARYLDRIEAITLARPYPQPAAAVTPTTNNIIDREINATLAELQLPVGRPINDAEYLRRVTLDLTGRLPGPDDVIDFLNSPAIDKRQRLIDQLLASSAFDDYWSHTMAGWLHLHSLPNETQSVDAFGKWIRQSVSDGVSWRDMTWQLLTSTGDSHSIGPANFCRMVGDARAHAELISEVFLGARMGCANCHDHPLDRWTQDDYHGLAAMLARIERGRQVQVTTRGDVTHPKTMAPARWRLPGDRFVDSTDPPLETLAQWLTEAQQARVSQAFTNRIWSEMFGRGLVEAVDDLRSTNPASHPQLLSQLAQQVAAQDFDLRGLLRWIVSSESYARESSERDDMYYGFHQSRQLKPHVLADAIADVTDVPMNFDGQPLGTRAIRILDPLAPAAGLDALGRCQRTANCNPASSSLGLATQLHLINGELINRKLVDPNGRLSRLVQHHTTHEIVREFALRSFGQVPDQTELDDWVQKIDSKDVQGRTERLQDWLWSMLSSQRFQRNR